MSHNLSAPSFDTLLYEKRNATAYVTLNRPEVMNALNQKAIAELHAAFEDAQNDPQMLASQNAKFGQPEIKLGLIPGFGGTQRLPRLVGKGVALQLILTGEMVSAEEAYRIGLVNEVVEAGSLIARAEAILARIAANAPLAVAYAMNAVNLGLNAALQEGLALEAKLFALCAATEDKKEGTTAFLEKRSPKFQGR